MKMLLNHDPDSCWWESAMTVRLLRRKENTSAGLRNMRGWVDYTG